MKNKQDKEQWLINYLFHQIRSYFQITDEETAAVLVSIIRDALKEQAHREFLERRWVK